MARTRIWLWVLLLASIWTHKGCNSTLQTNDLGVLPQHRLHISNGDSSSGTDHLRQTHPYSSWQAEGYRPWKYIVIHHSATESGNARRFNQMHRKRGWDELGYHFVITNGSGGQNGQVEVGPRWTKQKWGAHCGNTPNNEYNNYGIGICLVGDFGKNLPSDSQLASMNRLVTYLMNTYQIPPHRVIGHRDAPGAKTACPGNTLQQYIHTTLRSNLRR